jgi:uncharacterized protein (DUF362 family)
MITTIPADYFIMFVVGMVFSFGVYPNVRRTGTILNNKYFKTGLVYQTIFCMPIALYCYAAFPDWCWMYWLDSREAGFIFTALAFLGYYLLFTAGYAASHGLQRRGEAWCLGGIGVALLATLLFSLVNFKRLFFVGSFDEWKAGTLHFILHWMLLTAVVFFGMLFAVAALVVVLSYFGTELDHHLSDRELAAVRAKLRRVSIVKIEGGDLKAAIARSLNDWGGLDYLREFLAERPFVLLKPNLAGGAKDQPGTQTSPEFIAAVAALIRELKPDARILVGEAASIMWLDLRPLLEGSGYERLFREQGLEFVNLSQGRTVPHDFGGRMGHDGIAEVLTQNPLIIDLPVAKTHPFYRMSAAVKNMYGILPVPLKLLRYHVKGFGDWEGRVFLDVYRNFPPQLVLADGAVSGEGYCPVRGTAKRTGFVLSADDALAADMVLARIMHFNPRAVPYLNAAVKERMVPEYKIFGPEPEAVVTEKWDKMKLRLPGLIVNLFAVISEHRKLAKKSL